MARAGKFITFEGGEGTGKSTQATLLVTRLKDAGIDAIKTREPGGTPGAEIMRHLLKSGAVKSLGTLAEALIVSAARDDHLTQVIRPALARGTWVICDRFADSTRVYQGAAGGLEPEIINALERAIVGENQPDLTILLDAPAAEGMKRTEVRSIESREQDKLDRFDQEDIFFHQRLRDSFLVLAAAEPERFVIVDARQSIEEIAGKIWATITDKLLTRA